MANELNNKNIDKMLESASPKALERLLKMLGVDKNSHDKIYWTTEEGLNQYDLDHPNSNLSLYNRNSVRTYLCFSDRMFSPHAYMGSVWYVYRSSFKKDFDSVSLKHILNLDEGITKDLVEVLLTPDHSTIDSIIEDWNNFCMEEGKTDGIIYNFNEAGLAEFVKDHSYRDLLMAYDIKNNYYLNQPGETYRFYYKRRKSISIYNAKTSVGPINPDKLVKYLYDKYGSEGTTDLLLGFNVKEN